MTERRRPHFLAENGTDASMLRRGERGACISLIVHSEGGAKLKGGKGGLVH